MTSIANTRVATDSTRFYWTISFKKIFLFILIFPIILPFRIPVGDGSVALPWIVISLFLYYYFIKQIYTGFINFPSKFLAPFFIFTAFAFISIRVASDKMLGIEKIIIWSLAIVAMIIVRDLISSPENRSVFLRLLFFSAFLAGAVGLLIIILGLILGIDKVFDFMFFEIAPYLMSREVRMTSMVEIRLHHPLLNWTVKGGKIFRNISLFFSPTVAAGFFGLLAPVALSLYLNTKRRGLYLFTFFIIANVLLTMTRSSWIALFFAFGYVFLKSESFNRKMIVCASVIVFMATLLSFEPFNRRIFSETFSAEGSMVYRSLYLKQGLELVKAHSFYGIGFANYKHFSNLFVLRGPPHNGYIKLWAETGLGGLFGFLLILLTAFRRNSKKIRFAATPFDKGLYIGIVGSIIFFIVYSFFGDHLSSPPVIMTFMLLLGLGETDLTVANKTLRWKRAEVK